MRLIFDKRFIILFLVFSLYGIFTSLIAYSDGDVSYLFSDEETFLFFAERLSVSSVIDWSEEVQSCYVGLFPNSNLFGTVIWYGLVGKFALLTGIDLLILLRATNILVGFGAARIIVRYIETFSGVKISLTQSFLFTLPLLFFSPTLLRDNYIVLFTYLSALKMLKKEALWPLQILFLGGLVFVFRHFSLAILFAILFFQSSWNKPIGGVILALAFGFYLFRDTELIGYAYNFRLAYSDRLSEANLSRIISLQFPLNELGLLFYSYLGAFPFYTYIFDDLPRSLIRWPEMIFSLVLYYYVLILHFHSLANSRNVYKMIYIVCLFIVLNIELAMRRQMVLYPLLFAHIISLNRDYHVVSQKLKNVWRVSGVVLYVSLLLVYYLFI